MSVAIGHSSPSFCHDSIEATVRRMASAGFEVWEIFGEGGHAPQDHGAEFRKVLPSHSLKVQMHAPISDVNLGSLFPQAWDLSLATVEAALRGAATVGVGRVTIHPGNHTTLSQSHYGKVHEATRRALRRLDDVGNDLGLELCLENMPSGWFFETESAQKLLDLTQGTEFKLCLDLGHAHVAKRLPEFLDHVDRIANVHIHDNRGDFDAHLTLGEGTVPWQEAVRTLVAGGYRGTFVVESQGHPSGEASRKKLLDALKVTA